MATSKSIQVKVPPKTYERLVVVQAVFKMIRFFLDSHNDPDWEQLREKSGGNTFGMVDFAVTEHLRKKAVR